MAFLFISIAWCAPEDWHPSPQPLSRKRERGFKLYVRHNRRSGRSTAIAGARITLSIQFCFQTKKDPIRSASWVSYKDKQAGFAVGDLSSSVHGRKRRFSVGACLLSYTRPAHAVLLFI